jgi:uncharacterized membrane protein YraQ (UPF0718 family)/copper chaperone CopZ
MDISGIINEIVELFLEMSPYILFGLIFVGLLNLYFTKDLIIKHLGKNDLMSVIKASIFGIPLPLCSCGVVPASVYMAKSGASRGSVVSFLTSTPQTGIDSIIATYGMMGWLFAIYRPIAALLMGVFGGIITKFAEKPDEISQLDNELNIEIYDNTNKDIPLFVKIKKMISYSFAEFLDDIALQFIIGIIIAGLISYFIPDDFFEGTGITDGIVGMLLMILIGVPMYICATASIPIAITLILKGFSPGVAFVFLAVGPATNAATFAVIADSIGKKAAAIYVLSISVSAIIFGYILEILFSTLKIDPIEMVSYKHEHSELISEELQLVLGVIFLILLLMSLYRKYLRNILKKMGLNMDKNKAKRIPIEGMTCNHCSMTVEKAIKKVDGVKEVIIDLEEKAAFVDGDFDEKIVKQSIEDAGYKVMD